MPAEINSKGISKSGEPYPTLEIIKKMRNLNIPTLISDDAHKADNMGKDYDKVEKILQELIYTNRWNLNRE